MRTSDRNPEQHSPSVLPGPLASGAAHGVPRRRRLRAAVIAAGLVVVVGALGLTLLAAPGANSEEKVLRKAEVKRGDLTVSVTEGGTLRALKSLEIKNQVEGDRRTIVELVDEGTEITPQDVADGMVLVKLDSSDLEERESQQQIRFYNSEAAYKGAVEDLAIQEKQNESDVSIAELKVKFARMELERYLGKDLAGQVLQERMEFTNLAEDERLGGTAKQELRNLDSKVLLASAGLSNQVEKLGWTEKLNTQGYVGRNELTSDQLEKDRLEVDKQKAAEDLNLFKLYTLPKDAEQRYSDYQEANRELERVQARARSALAQKEANLKSTEASYKLDKERLEKLNGNVEKCTIRAPQPGHVVYPGSSNPWHRQQIREGERVWQNQEILSIPDMSTIAARVNVHETDVDKVKAGQDALISVEALPGKSFPGKVVNVSPVASAEAAWLNPDIKVYETDISLNSVPPGLTPGMSTTAEIIIARLTSVLYIPIEAVTTHEEHRVCWVDKPGGPELRTIQTGYFTEKFVEAKEGLQEGEVVYIDAPQELPEEETGTQPARLAELERLATLPEVTAPVPGTTEAAPGLAEAQQPATEPAAADQAASDYVVNGQINWQKLGPELRGLSDEERTKKLNDIRGKLSEDQRKVFDEALNRFQNMSDEERQQRRQQGRQGAGQEGG